MVEKPRADERGRDSRLMSEGVLRRAPCSPWRCDDVARKRRGWSMANGKFHLSINANNG